MLKLNSNGYIAHLIVNYTPNPYKYTRDLCGVIKGTFVALCGIFLMIFGVVIGVTVLFHWIVPLIAYGFSVGLLMERGFVVPFLVFSIVTTVSIFIFLVESLSKFLRNRKKDEPSPSIVAVWYDGFKNKYCPRVEFVDKS